MPTLEMKHGTAALARAVVAVVRRLAAEARVCLGSFQQDALDTVRAIAPEIATSASEPEARWTLHRSWVRWPLVGARPYQAFQVPERAGRLRVVSPGFVRQAHREGQVVQVWVVDREADAVAEAGALGDANVWSDCGCHRNHSRKRSEPRPRAGLRQRMGGGAARAAGAPRSST